MTPLTADQLDALLPQTQCELCEYPGCRPYAEAMANAEAPIDRCLPGGVRVLTQLAKTMAVTLDATMIAAMEQKQKSARVAVVREAECIGCTKCIQACPVDAIIGSSKRMHTVITDACNGCELCLPPCPVDCIDMESVSARDDAAELVLAQQSRQRYQQKQSREQVQQQQQQQDHDETKQRQQSTQDRQAMIKAAMARAKAKQADRE